MNRGVPRAVIGAGAALILALVVGTASARNLSSSSSQTFRVTWHPLTIASESEFTEIRFRVTVEGSFHSRTIAKVAGPSITRAILARPCERNTAWGFDGTETNSNLGNTTLPTILPWHLRYEGFTGFLPAVTGIRLLLDRTRPHYEQ